MNIGAVKIFGNINPNQIYTYKRVENTNLLSKLAAVDTVTFSGTPNSSDLKKLLGYEIPDMYSEIILLDPKYVENLMSKKVFSKSIRSIVKVLLPIKDSLFPVEKQVFYMMKNEAKKHPNMTLEEFVHKKLAVHSKKLYEIQKPIFKELDAYSSLMPEDLRKQYDKLACNAKRQLRNEETTIPFSKKEFLYKAERIKERIYRTKNIHYKKDMNKIIYLIQQMPETPKKKVGFQSYSAIKTRQNADINKIISYFEKSDLYNNKDLENLLISTKFKINGVSTNIKFSRKSFIYDLQKITNQLEDQKLAHKIIQKALELPTSKESISAFFVKAANRSSEQIGYDLISGSIGTIEHIIPAHKGGENNINNYAFASARYNSERAHRDFNKQLEKYPQTRIYMQKQTDRLIELANSKILSKHGIAKTYINSISKLIYRITSQNTPLILVTDELK